MSCQFARQLPNPLDGIQVGAVGWQESESNPGPARTQKRPQQSRMVIACIVEDQDHAAASRPMGQELAEELPERQGVKPRLLPRHQLPVPEVHRSEQGHGFSRRRMEQHGVCIFRRNPHHRPRTVLLEVALIQAPQIHPGITSPATEFFYIAVGPPDPLGQ